MSTRQQKPKLRYALRLRCPYCGSTPLRKENSWFSFREGCAQCNFCFEREVGYFGGASQMITFFVISLTALAMGALLLWQYPTASDLAIAGIVSIWVIVSGLVFFPFGMAIWIYFDHKLHPLSDEEVLH